MDIDWSTKSWISNVTYIKASTAAFIKRPSASALSQFYPMYDSLLVMDQMPSLEDKYTLNHLTSDDASDHVEASKNVESWLVHHVGKPRGTEIKTEEALPIAVGLETTAHMRPDVFYTYNHAGEVEAALIIEIDSKSLNQHAES